MVWQRLTRFASRPAIRAVYGAIGLALIAWCVRRQTVRASGIEALLSHAALACFLITALATPPCVLWLVRRHARLADLDGPLGRPRWLSPTAAWMALSLGLAGGGLALHRLACALETEQATQNLADDVHLKQHLVEHWFGDTLAALPVWMANPEFVAKLQAWREAGYAQGGLRDRVVEHLRRLSSSEHLTEVGLHDARNGALQLSTGGEADDERRRGLVQAAARASKPVLQAWHPDSGHPGDPYVGFLLPVPEADGSPTRTVAHVGLDPGHELFPLLQQWQQRATSAATLLLQTDASGLQVMYDSGMGAAANGRRRVAADQALFFAQISQTVSGAVSGPDEGGARVLAYTAPIPGTPWLIVAKVDEAEALLDVDTIALFGAALACSLTLLGAWWWVEQQGHLATQVRHRIERTRLSQRVDFLSKQANDCVFVCDTAGRILELNDRCLATYGGTRDQWLAAASPATVALDLPALLQRLDGQGSAVFESTHRRGDGSGFPVEVSARAIAIDGMDCVQVVVRDISDRRAAERRIVALSRLYATISAVNQAIVRGRDLESVFASVCNACVEHGRFRMAWVGLVDGSSSDRVRAVVSAGEGRQIIDLPPTAPGSDADATNPTQMAMQTGRPCVRNELARSEIDAVWHQRALRAGFACAIALPLIRGDITVGVLTVYGSEPQGFDPASVDLLQEMAANLAFAVDHFEQDRQRREAEHARSESAQKLERVSRRVVQVQEEERRRLAVELHDTAGTSLVAVQFNLALAERSLRGAQADATAILRESITMLAQVITNVRNICGELRPSVLDYVGLSSALQACVDNFAARTGLSVRLEQDSAIGRLPTELETVLYRIAQEALTNCAKHARAKSARLQLSLNDGVARLTIEDDGVGFDFDRLAHDGHTPGLGLLSMRERAEFMGGSLNIASRPGLGTRIVVELPVADAPQNPATGADRADGGR